MQRFVVCMKYGTVYPSTYVNVLFNAVKSSLRGDFRFICLTDDGAGLHPDVEGFPIPDIGLTPQEWFVGGVWPKIGLFDAHFHGLKGRALFIDLDMVVLRDLDGFFEIDKPFVGLNAGPGWGRGGHPTEFGSAAICYELGQWGHIVDQFRRDKASIMKSFRTEQAYVATHIRDMAFWPEGWIISFKRTLRRPVVLDLFLEPKTPPITTRMIAFHGTPRPKDLITGGPLFWDKFPHMGWGAVSWMQNYWDSNQ